MAKLSVVMPRKAYVQKMYFALLREGRCSTAYHPICWELWAKAKTAEAFFSCRKMQAPFPWEA